MSVEYKVRLIALTAPVALLAFLGVCKNINTHVRDNQFFKTARGEKCFMWGDEVAVPADEYDVCFRLIPGREIDRLYRDANHKMWRRYTRADGEYYKPQNRKHFIGGSWGSSQDAEWFTKLQLGFNELNREAERRDALDLPEPDK